MDGHLTTYSIKVTVKWGGSSESSKWLNFSIQMFVSLQRTTTEWISNRACAKHVRSKQKHAYLKFSVVNAFLTQIWPFTFPSFWGIRTSTAFHFLQGLSSIHEGNIPFAICLCKLSFLNFIRAQFKFLQNTVVKQGSARTFREELQSELEYYESFFKIYSALKLAERKGKIQKSFAEGEPSGRC